MTPAVNLPLELLVSLIRVANANDINYTGSKFATHVNETGGK
jgi:hypothetical protein